MTNLKEFFEKQDKRKSVGSKEIEEKLKEVINDDYIETCLLGLQLLEKNKKENNEWKEFLFVLKNLAKKTESLFNTIKYIRRLTFEQPEEFLKSFVKAHEDVLKNRDLPNDAKEMILQQNILIFRPYVAEKGVIIEGSKVIFKGTFFLDYDYLQIDYQIERKGLKADTQIYEKVKKLFSRYWKLKKEVNELLKILESFKDNDIRKTWIFIRKCFYTKKALKKLENYFSSSTS